jgi:hypothetical protein
MTSSKPTDKLTNGSVCSGAYPSKQLLWPPNNKFQAITINGATDTDGNQVAFTIDSVYSDEELGTEKGAMVPDALLVGKSIVNLRAKRLGGGNGRVYTIKFTASSIEGTTKLCSGSVKVGVPHDQVREPVDDGPIYLATV